MKNVQLNKGQVAGQEVTAFDILQNAVNTPPQGGFDAKTMAQACKVLALLDQHKGDSFINLEDADFDFCKEALQRARFNIPAPFILDVLKQFGVE